MSLRGQLNKVNKNFYKAVRGASMKGYVDAQGGTYGTRKIFGYVCNVHGADDENEELRGTVDVQEYEYEAGEDKYEGAGHHQGVYCSAIQNNSSGCYIMPTMYSDVVIVQDPTTLDEFVLMCSHVDVIQMQSHESVKVGVVETEAFQEDDENAPDYDELAETGNSATTNYDKEKIVQTVKTSKGNITITHTASQLKITTEKVTIAIDGSNIEITGGIVTKKGVANTDGLGAFCGIPVCPFSGAVHTGSTITE